jgi:nicotinamide-nucleotide adenylyltransferase
MTALFIGRFQPLHIGHITIIQNLLKQYDQVVVAIGSAAKNRMNKNPWTLAERMEVLHMVFGDIAKIRFISQVDCLDDDEWWKDIINKSRQIDRVYSGNSWVLSICEKHAMPFTGISVLYELSATKVRKRLSENQSIVDLVHPLTHDFITSSYQGIRHDLKSYPAQKSV